MITSLFLDQLRKKVSNLKKEKENQFLLPKTTFNSYLCVMRANNVLMPFVSIFFGTLAFTIIGYLIETHIKNSGTYLGSFLQLFGMMLSFNIFLWGIKSIGMYFVYKSFIKEPFININILDFFTIEGSSELIYFVGLPLFLFMYILNFQLSLYILGLFFVLKYIIIALSFDEKMKKFDRILLSSSSLFILFIVFKFCEKFIIGF